MKKNMSLSVVILLTIVTTLLGGCGIKPNKLDAPTPDKTAAFPKTYPQKAQ